MAHKPHPAYTILAIVLVPALTPSEKEHEHHVCTGDQKNYDRLERNGLPHKIALSYTKQIYTQDLHLIPPAFTRPCVEGGGGSGTNHMIGGLRWKVAFTTRRSAAALQKVERPHRLTTPSVPHLQGYAPRSGLLPAAYSPALRLLRSGNTTHSVCHRGLPVAVRGQSSLARYARAPACHSGMPAPAHNSTCRNCEL